MKNPQLTSYSMVRDFSSKMRNKTRIPAFATSIQHIIGSSNQGSQSRKRNKRHPNWERESKIISIHR